MNKFLLHTSVIFLFFFTISALSCKKDKSAPETPKENLKTGKNQLKTGAYLIDTLMVIQASENAVIMKTSAVPSDIRVGGVILSSPCKNAPEGFLRKIVSITTISDQTSMNTEIASLSDAFRELYVDAAYSENFSRTINATIKSSDSSKSGIGSNLPKIASLSSLNNGAKFMDANLKFSLNKDIKTYPGLELNGDLNVNISSVKFQYSLLPGSLKPEKFLLQIDLNTLGSNLEITNSESNTVTIGAENDFLPPIELPTFYVPIPIGPAIWALPLKHKISVKTGPVKISGKAKLNLSISANASLGVDYRDGKTNIIRSLTTNSTSPHPSVFDFEPNLALNANMVIFKPVYEISPFGAGALKAFFEIPNELDFTANLISTPNYALLYKLGVSGGISSKFWLGDESTISLSGDLFEKKILEGNWKRDAYSLSLSSGDDQKAVVNQKLPNPLKVLVKGIDGKPMKNAPVKWQVKSGGGRLSAQESMSDENGIAQVNWFVGGAGNQLVEAAINKADGTPINGSPVTFVANDLNGYSIELYEHIFAAKSYPWTSENRIGKLLMTIRPGDHVSLSGDLFYYMRVKYKGNYVMVGSDGKTVTTYVLKPVKRTAEDVVDDNYIMSFHDYTNQNQAQLTVKARISNALFRAVSGKTMEIKTDGKVTALVRLNEDGSIEGSTPRYPYIYHYSQGSLTNVLTCGSSTRELRIIGAISIDLGYSSLYHLPSGTIHIAEDGTGHYTTTFCSIGVRLY